MACYRSRKGVVVQKFVLLSGEQLAWAKLNPLQVSVALDKNVC